MQLKLISIIFKQCFFNFYYYFKFNIVLYLISKLFVISHRPLWFTLALGLSILDKLIVGHLDKKDQDNQFEDSILEFPHVF